jgi:hypothetical protein
MIVVVGPDRGALAAVVAVLSALAAVPAAAAHPLPDLAITKLELDGVGKPAHVVVSRDGRVTSFGVRVTVANVGKAKAGRSRLELRGNSRNRRLDLDSVEVRALKPGQQQTDGFDIHDVQFPLGTLEIHAKADAGHQVKERIERLNNTRVVALSVIPRQWLVQSFVTTEIGPFGNAVTQALSGFYFRFNHPDPGAEEFVYRANGDVMNTQPSSFPPCSVTGGSQTKGNSPWPHSYLRIGAELNYYVAIVAAELLPKYTVTVSCPGGFSHPAPAGFADLTTEGHQQMTENDTALMGSIPSSATRTALSWSFTADVR